MTLRYALLAPLLTAGLAASACTNTAAGAREDAKAVADKATAATADASKATKDAAANASGAIAAAAQKEEAGRIAAAEAPGYKIDNQLLLS